MQLRMLSLLTILFFNTNQIFTMELLKWTIPFFDFFSNKPKTQAPTNVPVKTVKTMKPLSPTEETTPEEKELIKKCNRLEPDPLVYAQNTHRLRFLAFLEREATTTDLPENKVKEYLKKESTALQKKFKEAYPDTNKEMVNSLLSGRAANTLIELYMSVRPQLIQNGTEKEYFKKRLDVHQKKFQDFSTLQAKQLLIMNLDYLNKVMKEANKKEEEADAFLNGDFKKKYKQLKGVADAIPKFLEIQKKYPNYKSREAFIKKENKSLFKLHSTIYNRTGFEPDFAELCCCASETPTEVLEIIYDNTCDLIMHISKRAA
jgi:hypothetical protein